VARRKKPEDETDQQTAVRRLKDAIADKSTRSEKVSWDRKMDLMVKKISELRPIEDEIVRLQSQKIPLFDEIAALRNEMVESCTHPFTHLTEKDGKIICKFCNHTFAVVNNG